MSGPSTTAMPLQGMGQFHPEVLSPGWVKFIEFCKGIGHGEIEKLKIANGMPVLAEKVIQKTKFA